MSDDQNNSSSSKQHSTPGSPAYGSDIQVLMLLGRLESEVRGVRDLLENYNARMDRQEEAHNDLARKHSEEVAKLWQAKTESDKHLTEKVYQTEKRLTWFTAAAAGGVGVIVWVLDNIPVISSLSK